VDVFTYLQLQFDFDSISIRLRFDGLRLLVECHQDHSAVTRAADPQADLFVYVGLGAAAHSRQAYDHNVEVVEGSRCSRTVVERRSIRSRIEVEL